MRILTIGMPIVAIAIAALNGTVITMALYRQSDRDSAGDWVILLSPVLVVLTSLVLSVAALLARGSNKVVSRAVLWGAFSACFLFLALQSAITVPRYELIAADGTAFWGLVLLPVVYVGLPLLPFGILIGLGAGVIASVSKNKKRRVTFPV